MEEAPQAAGEVEEAGDGEEGAPADHDALRRTDDDAAAARVVLLGASNVVMSLGLVLATAERVLGGRALDVLAAVGHGRSYGLATTVLGRRLPAILDCGLWPALADRSPRPLYALLADVGNDIGYGVAPEPLLGWLAEALDRLAAHGARTVVLALPTDSIERRSDRFLATSRRILFPRSRLLPAEARRRMWTVDAALRDLAAARGATVVAQRPEWYGLDPIHLRFTARRRAWAEVLAPWRDDGAPVAPPPSRWLRSLRLQALGPERRSIAGVERCHAQPVCRLPGGGSLSLY